MRNIAIGQAGGPTPVLNASLAGFIRASTESCIHLVLNGYQGLAEGRLHVMSADDYRIIEEHCEIPGAVLGSGRYPLTPQRMLQALEHLQQANIGTLVFIGGDGTMLALHQLSKLAASIGYDLQVIGIPKTVDNDLTATDHAPGFASAAKYVATSVRDISRDLEAMKNFEQVRILETMGRNSGWLAAASGFFKKQASDPPHHILIPEQRYTWDQIISGIGETLRQYGYAVVVVSEGVEVEGDQVEHGIVQGRQVLGGISKRIEHHVQSSFGVMARAELLGMQQRSSSLAVSQIDYMEAIQVGEVAAKWVTSGQTGVMVSIQRENDREYQISYQSCPLEKVAHGGERLLPAAFIQDPDRYKRWLRPLLGSDLKEYPAALNRSYLDAEKQIKP